MKRIAFISSGFTGSIMPLVQRLLDEGLCVDLYLQLFKTQNQFEFEALEQNYKSFGYGMHLVPSSYIVGLNTKFRKDRFRLFLVLNFGLGDGLWIKKFVAKLFNNMIIMRTVQKIKKEGYDAINVVGHRNFDMYYSTRLKDCNICHTFHEAQNHYTKDILPSVAAVISSGVPVVLPSNYLQHTVCQRYPEADVRVIPFGLFENYRNFFDGRKTLSLPPKYLLFLGNLLPYKGLDLLINAYDRIVQKGKKVKIVVAGNGRSEYLDSIKENDDFCILNRWITNREFTELISRSQGLICPYHSASQSGLPVVASLFKRKVLATNVGAMSEYIKEGVNGYLVSPNDIDSLSDQMFRMYDNDDFIAENDASGVDAIMSWERIKDLYKDIFEGK